MIVNEYQVIVLTSDRRNWLLRGFFHQWEKYGGGLPVTIAGFSPPTDLYSPLASFLSIGKFSDYPAQRWTDAILKLLGMVRSKYLLIMLEDYWLTRPIDVEIIEASAHWLRYEPDVLRFCLTTDRIYAENQIDLGTPPGWKVGMIEGLPPSTYQVSFQASMWNRINLLNTLVPGESPWQAELNGTWRLNNGIPYAYRVVGTLGWPIPYQIMVRQGEFIREGDWMYPPRQLSGEDYAELEALGYTHA